MFAGEPMKAPQHQRQHGQHKDEEPGALLASLIDRQKCVLVEKKWEKVTQAAKVC